jgi:hypothetical protein
MANRDFSTFVGEFTRKDTGRLNTGEFLETVTKTTVWKKFCERRALGMVNRYERCQARTGIQERISTLPTETQKNDLKERCDAPRHSTDDKKDCDNRRQQDKEYRKKTKANERAKTARKRYVHTSFEHGKNNVLRWAYRERDEQKHYEKKVEMGKRQRYHKERCRAEKT